jgi:dCMP deaminase
MKEKFIQAHMQAAYVYAALSSCERRKVGCVIVKDNSIIAIGYNGTPKGECNCCEDEDGNTKPHVIHAEDNALRKLTVSTNNGIGASAFVTLCPCIICAPRLIDAGIEHVYYSEVYHNEDGLNHLLKNGVKVTKVTKK